jgi:CHAD domain-containing protein
MKIKSDDSTLRFAAEVLNKHLAALQEEINGVRLSQDVEPLHRMRVAARRFRSTLPLFEKDFSRSRVQDWNKETRKVGKVLGTARDTDVKIERIKTVLRHLPDPGYSIGIHRLLVRLNQDRAAQQIKVLKALDRIESQNVIGGIITEILETSSRADPEAPFSAGLYRTSQRAVDGYLTELLAFDSVVDHPEMKTELHAMRVSAKRLRYALEAFAPLYPEDVNAYIKFVRQVQEQLGNIHDNDVWELYLACYRVDETRRTRDYYGYIGPLRRHWPGVDYLSRVFSDERQSIYSNFHEQWRNHMQNGWWSGLQAMISRPLSLTKDLYPPPRRSPVISDIASAETGEGGA